MKLKTITSLKVYLMQKNISQCKISNDTGLSRTTVNKLVNKNDASKSVKVLMRLYLELDEKSFNALCETYCSESSNSITKES